MGRLWIVNATDGRKKLPSPSFHQWIKLYAEERQDRDWNGCREVHPKRRRAALIELLYVHAEDGGNEG